MAELLHAEQHVYASVRPASVADLPGVVARLEPAAEWCGYALALYGSVQRHGQGRDFDFFFVPTRIAPPADLGEQVASRLMLSGVVVLNTERGMGRFAILGTLDGYALDVTVLERVL